MRTTTGKSERDPLPRLFHDPSGRLVHRGRADRARSRSGCLAHAARHTVVLHSPHGERLLGTRPCRTRMSRSSPSPLTVPGFSDGSAPEQSGPINGPRHTAIEQEPCGPSHPTERNRTAIHRHNRGQGLALAIRRRRHAVPPEGVRSLHGPRRTPAAAEHPMPRCPRGGLHGAPRDRGHRTPRHLPGKRHEATAASPLPTVTRKQDAWSVKFSGVVPIVVAITPRGVVHPPAEFSSGQVVDHRLRRVPDQFGLLRGGPEFDDRAECWHRRLPPRARKSPACRRRRP